MFESTEDGELSGSEDKEKKQNDKIRKMPRSNTNCSLRARVSIWEREANRARTRERAAKALPPRCRVSSRMPLAPVLFAISPKWRVYSQVKLTAGYPHQNFRRYHYKNEIACIYLRNIIHQHKTNSNKC